MAEVFPVPRTGPQTGERYTRGIVSIHFDRAEHLYSLWPAPTCIISDGPYGVSGFPGDRPRVGSLPDWYEPHIKAWSQSATPQTTLWFWNTEVGWATVHPMLVANGWEYRGCNVWDKGLSHVAGNANTQTLRKFPVVTEVCVHYVKSAFFKVGTQSLTMQAWLRHEWKRTGLPFSLANEACGVRNAATRKYLAPDHLWYCPPPEAFAKLVRYANEHGDPAGRPYFSVNQRTPLSGSEWSRFRAKFRCELGITNVWREPQLGGAERIYRTRTGMGRRTLHGNQKPLKFIDLIIRASTDPGDVVWEPFGGICPAAVVSHRLGRICHAAEIIPEFYMAAIKRLSQA